MANVSQNEQMSKQQADSLFKTADFLACTKACETAKKHHLMIGITADSGVGKTTALEAFAERKNVFYVLYEESMKPKQFFTRLLKAMGIPFDGSLYDMIDRIAEALNVLPNPLVIIDEAGKLKDRMILYLHDLRNKTHKNCGLVMAGMPYFESNLIKFSNKQKIGYGEFFRRVNVWHTLEGLSNAEIEVICKYYGIEDKETVRMMKAKKRFGDLYNAILLFQIQNAA